MEKRINEVELDEFDKLLGEIPSVTSVAPITQEPGLTKGTLGSKSSNRSLYHEDPLTSAFAELSFNDTSSPLIYEQYPNGVQELPRSFNYLPSFGPSLGNNFMAVDPSFRFIPNVPNVQGIEFPISQIQRLRAIDKEQYYRMHQRLLSERSYLANGNMTPHHLMSQNFQNHDTSFEFSNQEVLWNKGHSVPRDMDLTRLWSHGFQEKVLPKLLGLNYNERVFTNNNKKVSSNLFSNFKPMLQRYSSIDEVAGRIYFMAKDQNGCRFLQRKFAEGTQKDVEMIFSEIIMHVVELMTDPFGNYLVQKLLEVCDEDQSMQVLRSVTRKPGDFVRISCDMHGTRVVQKIVETLKSPEQISLFISSLSPAIVTLMKNINGNHVAQKCLQNLSPGYSEFIYEAAFASCVELATDRHGCCVIQKCLSQCGGDKRHHLMCEITSNALILAQDQYGNYVVQFMLKTRVSWAILAVFDQLKGSYGDLSMQKYSSNVIEKCLKYTKEEHQCCIIQELISDSRFDQILQDPYGNYVIQAALKRSKATLRGALVEAVRSHISLLRTSPYGKKVLQAIA